MDHDLLFSSVPERWSEISDFPGYSVSDWGRVQSASGHLISPTRKPNGLLMVGLMCGEDGQRRKQTKRSLTLLVARAFLPDPGRPAFDTPINLDGDRSNNHYANLMWRPLWFARKYSAQFDVDPPLYDNPIEDVETGIVYKNLMEAATTHGLLAMEIRKSMLENTYVWPTGQVFREAL